MESEADILGEIERMAPVARHPAQFKGGDDDADPLLASMGYDPVTVDTIVQRSGLTADKVCSILLRLEMQGLVRAVVGGRYMRVA